MPLTAGLMVPHIVTPPPVFTPDFYVSPTGSSANSGSLNSPWSLTYALAGANGVITAGKQIGVLGGTYFAEGGFLSSLTGTITQPIVVRAMPGQRATIMSGLAGQATLFVNGSDTWYWGLEITNTNVNQIVVIGVDVFAPRAKFINMIVHDISDDGFGVWDAAPGAEVYGCLVYNNGYHGGSGSGFGHGIYSQANTGTKQFRDNLCFLNFGFGFHFYADQGQQKNQYLEGNASFLNGAPSVARQQPNIFIGAGNAGAVDGVTLLNNRTYKSSPDGSDVWLGYPAGNPGSAQNGSIQVIGNYFTGGYPCMRIGEWTTFTSTNNTVYAGQVIDLEGALTGHTWSGNQWFADPAILGGWVHNNTSLTYAGWLANTGFVNDTNPGVTPTGTNVLVRPNIYEQGRGHVIIYNWNGLASVSVDVSSILSIGQQYEVLNCQDYYGTPVLTGTYAGGSLSFPMAAITPPAAVGVWREGTPPSSGPTFQAFVVRLVGTS